MVQPVHFIMPRTSVPMVVAGEVKNSRSLNVQRHILVLGQLVQKVTGVGSFISTTPIIRASHVGAHADALIGPALPLPVSIQTNRNDGRLRSRQVTAEQEQNAY